MQTIGILLPELGEGYHSQVLSGVGDLLMRKDYFYFKNFAQLMGSQLREPIGEQA